MTSWAKRHGLLLVNAGLFAVFLIGMTLAGWQVHNEEQREHGSAVVDLATYLLSGEFGEALFENWESEFLQMGMYVVLTVFLFQRGSSESKPLDEPAPQDADPRTARVTKSTPWPVRRGGWLLGLYEYSLSLLFFTLFLASFALHAVKGAQAYSAEQHEHGLPGVTPIEYLGTSQFWFESFQNWQSEFMVVAVIVLASVYLRQRGSPESKPVAMPHAETEA